MPQAPVQVLETVVVTGSAREQRVRDAPYAITAVGQDELRTAGPMVHLSEALVRVPGLVVANRHNQAQDLQLSSRGFGARAGFGVRGLRLYEDGIPATMPDGQGQVAHLDLAGAQRVEVLRGPYSVLYGSSSGGVISVFSAPVRERRAELAADLGSHGLRQWRAGLELPLDGRLGVSTRLTRMDVEGFRAHSQARRELASVRLAWRDGADRITLAASHHRQQAQDPLGLTRAQFERDPYQTAPQAPQFDTRKAVRQSQVGLSWRRGLDHPVLQEAQLSLHAGSRGVVQFLAIPTAVQAGATHGGGVVDFDRRYGGAQAQLAFGWDKVQAVAGVAVEAQRDDRRGYENFTASGAGTQLGVRGTLRRDEVNRARTRDAYAQAQWELAPAWALIGGVRAGQVQLSARDRFLDNGDDSGQVTLRYANPVLGLRWQASPTLTWHASAARGFESPTLGEVAYRSDGSGGFNEALRPQRSRQLELGLKWHAGRMGLDAALFHIHTENEIAVATNAGGRASFQNVGRTQRQGVELGGHWEPAAAWRLRWAFSWLQARYRDGFLACAAVPCTSPDVPVPAGLRIAGAQPRAGWAELAWRPPGGTGEWALEWRGVGRTAVNDRNTDFAAGYSLWHLRWSHTMAQREGLQLEMLARIDNLADRVHVGSIIVNEGNGRFFETGAPRSVWVGLRLSPRW